MDCPSLKQLTDALKRAESASCKLDQMAWAYVDRYAFPLAHYDEDTWLEQRGDGKPSARLVTDPGAAFRFLVERHPKHRIDIKAEKGVAAVEIRIFGLGTLIAGNFKGKIDTTQLGIGLTIALTEAHAKAIDMEQRLLKVYGVAETVAPFEDWPIEQLPDGKFYPVDHENRLAAHGFATVEIAQRNIGLNHKGDYGMMICRERYEALIPAPDAQPEAPGF